MCLRCLKRFKNLAREQGHGDGPTSVLWAYAVISEREGKRFVEENIDRILRAARACLSLRA